MYMNEFKPFHESEDQKKQREKETVSGPEPAYGPEPSNDYYQVGLDQNKANGGMIEFPSLNEFKKKKEDKNYFYFEHPQGHEIKMNKDSFKLQTGEKETALPNPPKTHYDEGGGVEAPNQPPQNVIVPNQVDPSLLPTSVTLNPGTPQVNPQFQNQAPSFTKPSYSNLNVSPTSDQNAQNTLTQNLPTAQDYQNIFAQKQSGISQEAQAVGQQGKAEAQAAGQASQALGQVGQSFKTNSQSMLQERDNAIKDYAAGNMNSSHFYDNMSTAGKLSTAVGLILGGIGSGVTHQGNMALNLLNQQIERDVNDQAMNMNKKQNLVGAYQQQFHNLRDATDMTKATLLAKTSFDLQKAASQSKDPLAQARAQQASADVMNQSVSLIDGIKIRNQLLNQSTQGNTQNPAVAARFLAPDDQTRKEAFNEIKQQENINSMNKYALNSFDKVSSLQNISSRVGSPVQSSKSIDAEWDPMIDKVTKNTEGRVVPITVDLMSSLKPSITDSQEVLQEKREKLLGLLNTERSTPVLNSIGVNYPKNAGMARSNANAPSGYKNQR